MFSGAQMCLLPHMADLLLTSSSESANGIANRPVPQNSDSAFSPSPSSPPSLPISVNDTSVHHSSSQILGITLDQYLSLASDPHSVFQQVLATRLQTLSQRPHTSPPSPATTGPPGSPCAFCRRLLTALPSAIRPTRTHGCHPQLPEW